MKQQLWSVVAVALCACSSAPADGGPRGAESAPAPVVAQSGQSSATVAAPEIGRLKLRDETLVMRASGSGPRFDVITADGRVVRRNVGEQDLALTHHELWDVYRSATAKGGPFLDARLDPVAPARDSTFDDARR